MRFKRMTDILSRMIDNTITNTSQINDFSTGSATRAIYEAVSIEIEQFYMLTRENIAEGIEYGVYAAFDFEPKQATRSSGIVQITFNNPTQNALAVPRGSRFSTNISEYPQMYETLEDFVITSGSIAVDVEVYCTQRGTIGNIPPNVISVMRSPLANVKKVDNPNSFQTGEDREPVGELHARFNSFIESRGRGTMEALEYGAREVEEISGVYIKEMTGQIVIYAHDRNGNLSDLVKEKVREAIQEYRPAGIRIDIEPVNRMNINIVATVTLTRKSRITNSFKVRIEDEITKALNSMNTSESLILANLSRKIMEIDGVIYDVDITSHEDNVVVKPSDIIRAGSVTVTLV